MIYRFTLAALTLSLALGGAAQDRLDKEDKKAPQKEDKQAEKKEAGDDGDFNPEKVKEIVSRLDDNYGKATDRLDKKDAGQETRGIQEQIIKDLDELIKQKQKSNSGGGGSSSSGGLGQEQPDGGSSGQQQQQQQQQSGGKGSGQQKQPMALNDQQKNQGGQGQKKEEGMAKAGPRQQEQEKKQGAGAGAKENEEKGKTGGSGVGKNNDTKDKNTIADLYPGVWGMLPASERPKMDVYSRERFMPRYEDLLRQYYRTIAEQGKRNEGEP